MAGNSNVGKGREILGRAVNSHATCQFAVTHAVTFNDLGSRLDFKISVITVLYYMTQADLSQHDGCFNIQSEYLHVFYVCRNMFTTHSTIR